MFGLPMWSRMHGTCGHCSISWIVFGQVAVVDADVEREAVVGQQLHAAHEAGLEAELQVRLELDDAPDALDDAAWPSPQRVEECARLVAVLQRRPGDDALDARVLRRPRLDPLRLQQRVGRLDLDLEVDHRLDRQALGVRAVLGQPVGLVRAGRWRRANSCGSGSGPRGAGARRRSETSGMASSSRSARGNHPCPIGLPGCHANGRAGEAASAAEHKRVGASSEAASSAPLRRQPELQTVNR